MCEEKPADDGNRKNNTSSTDSQARMGAALIWLVNNFIFRCYAEIKNLKKKKKYKKYNIQKEISHP